MTKHNKISKIADPTPLSSTDGFSFDNGSVAFSDPFEVMEKRHADRAKKRAQSRARYVPKGHDRSREMNTKHGRV